MLAVTVEPRVAGSVRYEEVAEPDEASGSVLVDAVAVGICGTDVEITTGAYGWAPPGRQRLVLGHESLGRVVDPGPRSGLQAGDLVVGIVRRPDPVPCPNCAVGEWDMCRNGQYTERGIKQIDGFMSERWRIEPEYVMKVDPTLGLLGVLLEPTTVVAKAWEQVSVLGSRAFWEPRQVLVTGAGPIGLLAALLGRAARARRPRPRPGHGGRQAAAGRRPRGDVPLGVGQGRRVRAGRHHRVHRASARSSSTRSRQIGAGGVLCLTGVGSGGRTGGLRAADVATELVLQNNVIVGSVNANKRHFYKAAQALAAADRDWLGRLVSRRVAPADIADALTRGPDDIKVVVDFEAGRP